MGLHVQCLRFRDVLEEDGSDDAATTPHQGDFRLVQLPLVFLGSLFVCKQLLKMVNFPRLTFWINMKP